MIIVTQGGNRQSRPLDDFTDLATTVFHYLSSSMVMSLMGRCGCVDG
ncbi:hypothetical protein [uncultured Corynebacterium sp.]|nr:hypothetical protein [uncultured Corynebacterium sp.]